MPKSDTDDWGPLSKHLRPTEKQLAKSRRRSHRKRVLGLLAAMFLFLLCAVLCVFLVYVMIINPVRFITADYDPHTSQSDQLWAVKHSEEVRNLCNFSYNREGKVWDCSGNEKAVSQAIAPVRQRWELGVAAYLVALSSLFTYLVMRALGMVRSKRDWNW